MTPSEAPPSPPAEVGEEVRAAQEKLRRSITIAGLIDDPMRHVLEALATHIGAQHRMHVDAGAMLAEAIRRAQQPVSDETIRRLEAAAANGADRRAFGIIREHWRRNIMLAAGVLFGAMGVAAGYFWGRAKAFASVRQTEAGLQTMFRDGPDAAATWLSLATWNDPQQVLAVRGRPGFRPERTPRVFGTAVDRGAQTKIMGESLSR